jgi:hypothetical protein
VRLVRAGNRLKSRSNSLQLRGGQLSREVLADPAEMPLRRSPDPVPSSGRQFGENHPPIFGTTAAFDQPSPDQIVDRTSQPAGRHHHSLGEFRHRETTPRNPRETDQDIILTPGQTVIPSELCIERLRHFGMRVEEGLPSFHLEISELFRHHDNGSENDLLLQANI